MQLAAAGKVDPSIVEAYKRTKKEIEVEEQTVRLSFQQLHKPPTAAYPPPSSPLLAVDASVHLGNWPANALFP
jgi:hypothetical protein